jgi:hypothetical protein
MRTWKGGGISGPIQRTYVRRGLASYVVPTAKPGKSRNGAARTGQKQNRPGNSGPEVDVCGLMDGNIRRNRASSALCGCGEDFFNAFIDRDFLGHAVYSDSLQEPPLAIVMET